MTKSDGLNFLNVNKFLPAQMRATKNLRFSHKRSPARISLVKGEKYSRYAEEPELINATKLPK